MEHEMLSTLKPETMRTRFFSIISDISHEMLVRFCNIDYEREMAIVAEVREGERKKIVGIGRLIVDPDFREAEYAVLVHDDFQGKGLGYKLVDVLIGVAQDMGLEGIHGTVLSENDKMLRIILKLGFTMKREEDGETTSVPPGPQITRKDHLFSHNVVACGAAVLAVPQSTATGAAALSPRSGKKYDPSALLAHLGRLEALLRATYFWCLKRLLFAAGLFDLSSG